MKNKIIDLRSDTVTYPTEAMRQAMMDAPVGDDVYAEDPTVNSLEKAVAEILGKEAALFVPSGTMANQIAIHLHCRPGETVLTEENAHCFKYEAGGAAALSGVQFDFVAADDWKAQDVLANKVRGHGLHEATTSLLVLENTHNYAGGRAMSADMTASICAQADRLGLKKHCDGARLWNAAVATGSSEAELVAGFDTVAVCFSKGLGAPMGSALAGSQSEIALARKIRKRFGGGMRQVGIVSAGALYALSNNRKRLGEDHQRAKDLFESLKQIGIESFKFPDRPTNMVYFRMPQGKSVIAASAYLRDQGVLMSDLGAGWLRAVVHMHIDDSDIQRVLSVLKSAF